MCGLIVGNLERVAAMQGKSLSQPAYMHRLRAVREQQNNDA
jgi:hypothetical protein